MRQLVTLVSMLVIVGTAWGQPPADATTTKAPGNAEQEQKQGKRQQKQDQKDGKQRRRNGQENSSDSKSEVVATPTAASAAPAVNETPVDKARETPVAEVAAEIPGTVTPAPRTIAPQPQGVNRRRNQPANGLLSETPNTTPEVPKTTPEPTITPVAAIGTPRLRTAIPHSKDSSTAVVETPANAGATPSGTITDTPGPERSRTRQSTKTRQSRNSPLPGTPSTTVSPVAGETVVPRGAGNTTATPRPSPIAADASVTPMTPQSGKREKTADKPEGAAAPGAQATPFVPTDMPDSLKPRSDRREKAGKSGDALSTGTPTRATPATPRTRTDKVTTAPGDVDSKATPFVPTDMPKHLQDEKTEKPKDDTPAAAVSSSATTPGSPGSAAAPTPRVRRTPRAIGIGMTTASESLRGKSVPMDQMSSDAMTGAAARLFGKDRFRKKGDPAKIKLTPFIGSPTTGTETLATGTEASTIIAEYNPPPVGSTPTPTPAPERIVVSNTNITNIVQNITLVPTPLPAPTPGVTPVPPPPNVTPVPPDFRPPHNWRPYPGWAPVSGWKPPAAYVPPGGWNPPPGWTPPPEWIPRLENWGWRYIARRGWVVDVRWVPPPDFVTPPGWYYLPPDAYEAYGLYDPGEVVVMPGAPRRDLVVNISVHERYVPPPPPPVIVLNAPPPPARMEPPAPIETVQVDSVDEVVEVLSRPRQPNAPRYEGPVLVTGSIHFDYDDYSIKPESFATLDRIGDALVNPPLDESIINVEGHTDSDGSDEYNQKLSERRAWSVKSYLVQKFGMDPNRLVIVGYGERAPITSNSSDRGKAQNRRVEFENVTDLYKAQVLETSNE